MRVKLLRHQYDYVTSGAKHPLLLGGYGAGKTRAFIARAVREMLDPANEGKVILLAEPTYPMLRDVLVPDLLQTLDDFRIPYVFHKSEMTIRHARGTVLLRSAENYQRWRGLNLAAGGIDEVAQLRTEGAWMMLLSRLRDPGTLTGFASTTPEGLNFVYDLWEKTPGDGYTTVRARTTDNPYLPDDFIESLRQNYSTRMLEQYLEGRYVILEGRVYEEYTEESNDDWQYTPGLPVSVAMDFGYNRPSILWIQMDRTGADHVFHETTLRNTTTHAQAQAMREYADGLGLGEVQVYCDPAGAGHQSAAHMTDVAILREFGFCPIFTTSPVLRSISAGVELMQARFLNGRNERRLFVNREACPNLHRSLLGYRYKPGNQSQPDKDGINDHDCDALRYYVINRYGPAIAEGRNVG